MGIIIMAKPKIRSGSICANNPDPAVDVIGHGAIGLPQRQSVRLISGL